MAYTSDSPTDRLSAVRAAIDRCLTSQEYEIGGNGRRQRMADLKDLRAIEKDLQDEANSSAGGGSMSSLAECGRVL